MNYNDVYVILDSWGAGYNDETGKDRDGWAQQLNIPEKNILAESGSTAGAWAFRNEYRDKLCAIPRGSFVICFMGGNDARGAVSDGVVTDQEKMELFSSLDMICEILKEHECLALIFGYADPYRGTVPELAAGLEKLNAALRAVACLYEFPFYDLRTNMIDEHFLPANVVRERGAIHPNTCGYSFLSIYIGRVIHSWRCRNLLLKEKERESINENEG